MIFHCATVVLRFFSRKRLTRDRVWALKSLADHALNLDPGSRPRPPCRNTFPSTLNLDPGPFGHVLTVHARSSQ